jgi:hypothetical protein
MDRIQIRAGSLEQFPSLFRRLSRIFSHAYYHHRETFHLAEAETSLYARFVALCEKYDLVGSNLLVIPRHVVADILDGKSAEPEIEVEEEDEDEDEEDEDEDEGDEERDSRSRDKGESGRRPHSLDRHARPHELGGWRQKGPAAAEGTVRGWPQVQPAQPAKDEIPIEAPISETTQDTATASSSSSSTSDAASIPGSASTSTADATIDSDPISLNTSKTYSLKPRFPRDGGKSKPQSKDKEKDSREIGTKEFGTLGRSTQGKKSRGTMLWTSDSASEPSVPPTQDIPSSTSASEPTPVAETEGAPLERTESVETAILAPEDLEGDGPMPALGEGEGMATGTEEAGEEEMPVPKDEIELLEEEGKLDMKAAVSPLRPTTTTISPSDLEATSDTDAAAATLPSTSTTESTSTDDVLTKARESSESASKASDATLSSGTKTDIEAKLEQPKTSNSTSANPESQTNSKGTHVATPSAPVESSVLGTGEESESADDVEKAV